MMNNLLPRLMTFCIALMCAGAVHAGDFEDANAALLKKDYATALKFYRAAASKNDSRAQFQMGNIYSEGLGVKQDYVEGFRWYKLAAAQGLADA
jgi:TPR repeat protein